MSHRAEQGQSAGSETKVGISQKTWRGDASQPDVARKERLQKVAEGAGTAVGALGTQAA